jgi:hypothetical protein
MASGIIRRQPMIISALVVLLLLAALVQLYRACIACNVGVRLPAWSWSHAPSLVLAAAGMLSVAGGCSLFIWALALLPAAAAYVVLRRLRHHRYFLTGSLVVISATGCCDRTRSAALGTHCVRSTPAAPPRGVLCRCILACRTGTTCWL